MDFESEFIKNNTTRIQYKGETIYLVKDLKLPRGRVVVEYLERDERLFIQGAVFMFLDSDVEFLNRLFKLDKKHGTSIRIWYKGNKYKSTEFKILDDSRVRIYNTWDDNGYIRATAGGAGMKVEQIEPNKYLFKCNDGEKDEDFNDFVFTVKIIPESEAENSKSEKATILDKIRSHLGL